jgi:molybdenum cofactor cytidylyltransferase
MGRALSLCGVILAAGESVRMGRNKALLPWPAKAVSGSGTFLSAAINAFVPYNDMVIVVAGKYAAEIASVVYANGGFLVENPAPDRGQFSSLQVGLHEVLNRGRDAAMVTLVDRPPVRSTTIEHLLEAFESATRGSKWAVVPHYGERHGHPFLVARDMIEAFLKAPPTATAREVEHEHQDKIQYVPVDDGNVILNVDTPADYETLKQSVAPLAD